MTSSALSRNMRETGRGGFLRVMWPKSAMQPVNQMCTTWLVKNPRWQVEYDSAVQNTFSYSILTIVGETCGEAHQNSLG